MIKNFKWLLLVSLTFIACTDENEAVVETNSSDGLPLTAGTANFSKYVSLGDSYSAGYSDGALFIKGQEGGFTNILSQQFALVGGGEFKIPYMNDNVGGLLLGGFPIAGPRLYYTGSSTNPIVPVSGTPTTEVLNVLTGPFNNMGVPGAKSFHLLSNSYGNPAGIGTYANPYFVRFASSTSARILTDATDQHPTFFSLWIGNNDVLSYATSGGTGLNQVGNFDPTTYGGNDITDPNVFASVYSTLLDGLTAEGAGGVVATIPYVTAAPFFTAVPTNPIPGLPAANAGQLNQLFGAINQITTVLSQPSRFATLVADDGNPATTEKNPLLIIDETLPNLAPYITGALTPVLGAPTAGYLGNLYGRARHARNTVGDRDFILLTSKGIIGTTQAGAPSPFNVIGVSNPMQDGKVITADEALQIKTATDAYNVTIHGLATAKGIAFVDVNAVLAQLSNGGISNSGYTVNSDLVTGGGFSLDGIHACPRGYALLTNEFLKAINAVYGSNFKGVKFSDYSILYKSSL